MKNAIEVIDRNVVGKKDIIVPFSNPAGFEKMRFLWVSGFFDSLQLTVLKEKLGNAETISNAKCYLQKVGLPWEEYDSGQCIEKRNLVLWEGSGIEQAARFETPFDDLVYAVHGNRPVSSEERKLFKEACAHVIEEREKYLSSESANDDKFLALNKEFNELVRSKGFNVLLLTDKEYFNYNLEFKKNRWEYATMNKKVFGLEHNENALFVLYNDKADEIVGVVKEQDISYADCLEMAIMKYKTGQTMLEEKEEGVNCYRLDDVGKLEPVTLDYCKSVLQNVFNLHWRKTLESVLKEKGNTTEKDYMDNGWFKDVGNGIVHPKKTGSLGVKKDNSAKDNTLER